MKGFKNLLARAFLPLIAVAVCAAACERSRVGGATEPVDYVNPYAGNVSHLLVPTFPTVHLPNSMVRMVPLRGDYTGNRLSGLPVQLTGHRGAQAFALSPWSGAENGLADVIEYEYDHETVRPYFYAVYLDNAGTEVRFAPSHQSAIYEFAFRGDAPRYLVLNSRKGRLSAEGNTVSGYQEIGGGTRVFIYLETDLTPDACGLLDNGAPDMSRTESEGSVVMRFDNADKINARYGISYISAEQAERNLRREIEGYDLDAVADTGRALWNETLGKIGLEGGTEDEKAVFYTSLYRTYERMVCISEDGRYYSAYDGRVHDDGGTPFYVDDWLWDTYRATHPLRTIIEPEMEGDMVASLVRIAEESGDMWMPNFPGVAGDSHSMNCNHGAAVVADCLAKGLDGFDAEKAYLACKGAVTEKTLAPWSGMKAGELDRFYAEHGYFPALRPGEKETAPEVHYFEKRQPVAVTLGTVYDEWCLAQIAAHLGKGQQRDHFLGRSRNYLKVFNPETGFFHPKDSDGMFITPFDYRYSGGLGAREAYDENNGWIYRWDVQHDIAGLIGLLGGPESFVAELERMYDTPLGKSKYDFYATLPDHTGNVGQFSMANEPCLHIPYLYNYAGQPWRTQKRTRTLLEQWFRNDLMGVPGDEDGGGMSAFVVFSMMGFYPVTPGLPVYALTSPVFESISVEVGEGREFEIVCENYSPENRYIQSARLNGEEWERSWIRHEDIASGGRLELVMGRYPNKEWASSPDACPPSFEMPDNL